VKIGDGRFRDFQILDGRARADTNPTDDRAIHSDGQAPADDREVPAIGDVDAKGRLAGLAELIVDVSALAGHSASESLVDGDRNRADLAAIHAVERNQMPGLVADGDAHG